MLDRSNYVELGKDNLLMIIGQLPCASATVSRYYLGLGLGLAYSALVTTLTQVGQTEKLLRHESLPVYFRASPGSHVELPILISSSCNCQNIDGIHDGMYYR